jgi:hypothetical protein
LLGSAFLLALLEFLENALDLLLWCLGQGRELREFPLLGEGIAAVYQGA